MTTFDERINHLLSPHHLALSVAKTEAVEMLLRDRVHWPFPSDAERRATAGVLARLKLAMQEGQIRGDS